ncbi:MAG: transglutaminase family protein [Vicinamibacterales bacterium]
MDPFLRATDVIDWTHPAVLEAARALRGDAADDAHVAARCYAWVRDEIRHSADFGLRTVTCRASDVLRHGTGYCYAKSHLLAALLRANGIPAGLAYQRLALDEAGVRFCLHGLNAVWLPESGWYRIDARGNKPGIDAGFEPPRERLAFTPRLPGERDVDGVLPDPLPIVVAALGAYEDAAELGDHLPDLP